MNAEMHFNKIELSQGVEADDSQLEEQILEIVGESVAESRRQNVIWPRFQIGATMISKGATRK